MVIQLQLTIVGQEPRDRLTFEDALVNVALRFSTADELLVAVSDDTLRRVG